MIHIAARTILILLTLACPLRSDILVQTEHTDVSKLKKDWITPITLEHAVTNDQLSWGLMQRKSMPADHGMTFNFTKASNLNFWMFNVLMDLSVAFCDEEGVIREIYSMQAHPEKLDPKRPVKSPVDLGRYPTEDPILRHFKSVAIQSKIVSRYALEMSKDWFKEHHVKAGDIAVWHVSSEIGFICHTLDIDQFIAEENKTLLLDFSDDLPHSVWAPNSSKDVDIAFLDKDFNVLQKATLAAGKGLPIEDKPVLFSGLPAYYVLVGPKGWNKMHIFKDGITVEKEIAPSGDQSKSAY